MKKEYIDLSGHRLPLVTCNTVVIGSGAAGFHAAIRLLELEQTDIVMVTEGVRCGTSRNTGSDKQTYYKLGLSGDQPDCPHDMALDLFRGQCVDGDHALAEAALSARCFYHLCELGVPFPCNAYGEYVGYKTDHDPRARATSCGPLTSRLMTEALERRADQLGLTICDRQMAVSILHGPVGVAGLLTLDMDSESDLPFTLYRCANVILATGGPAGIYRQSVYPVGHAGSSGMALEAGALGKNLTEWQYGLASVRPRWNVSGTYMQVLPRFVSVDPDGTQHEFLSEYFETEGEMLSNVFQKGYEWPFDSRKVLSGSSVIDLLTYRETAMKGRRVYLDFTRNPNQSDSLDFSLLSEEARCYLTKAGATFGRPIDRLLHMNEPAYQLYRSKGVDLKTDLLEIALCAQHHNGGLDVDAWWQTGLHGLFAVGECAGTHGVHRPGGSALNAGQVGSLRAAQYIAAHRRDALPSDHDFQSAAENALLWHENMLRSCMGNHDSASKYHQDCTARMSQAAGAIRQEDTIRTLLADVSELLDHFTEKVCIPSRSDLPALYRLRDLLLTQQAVLSAMLDYIHAGGASRGSALYRHEEGSLREGLEEEFRFILDDAFRSDSVQLIQKSGMDTTATWRPVRPLPEGGGFFETVWRQYRENQNIVDLNEERQGELG